jgi:hypothetical protein
MTTIAGTPKKPRRRQKAAPKWHLVTNHQNMLYMLAAGLVMSPAGFRGKHYSDCLNVYPGWIPLFLDKVKIPEDALSRATAERRHLLPCVASFDLRGMTGRVRMLSRDGRIRDVASPDARKRKDDIAILVRAPLPTAWLSSISFRSAEDRRAFESAASDVSNVDLESHQIAVSESLYAADTGVGWAPAQPQEQLLADGDDAFPAFGQALGGALAMLYQIANRSDLGLATFRLATGDARDEDVHLIRRDSILAELPGWMKGDETFGQTDGRARLFWGVVRALVAAKTQERPQTSVDVVLEYLDSQLGLLRETESRPRLERLIADLRGCLGLGAGTVTELLERHKGSLSRPLLLFCLRENCTELLEFSNPLLTDAEYVLAGVLFGVRDGWLGLPKELRDPEVSGYAACRMADAEHRGRRDDLNFSAPPRPKPVRELFAYPGAEWNSRVRDVALELAGRCKWQDCIRTRITLAEGDYPDSFERNDLQVVLPGRVATVTEELDMAAFMRRLGQWPPIDVRIEAEVRKNLKGAWESEEKAGGQ